MADPDLEEAQENAERWRRKCVQVEAEVRALRVKLKELQFKGDGARNGGSRNGDAQVVIASAELARAEESEKKLREVEHEKGDLEETIRLLADKLEKYESTDRLQQQYAASTAGRLESELTCLREECEALRMREADQVGQFDRILLQHSTTEVERHRKKAQLNNKALLNLREELDRTKKTLEGKCVDLTASEEKLQSLEMEIAEERRKHKETLDATRRVKDQLQKEKDCTDKGREMSENEELLWELQRAEDTVRRLEEEVQTQKLDEEREVGQLRQQNAELRDEKTFLEERNAYLEQAQVEKCPDASISLLEEERGKLKSIAAQAMEKQRVAQAELLEFRRQTEYDKCSPLRRSAKMAMKKAQVKLAAKKAKASEMRNGRTSGVADWRGRMEEWTNESARISTSVRSICKNLKRDFQKKNGGGSAPSTEIDRLNALVDALLDHVSNLDQDCRRVSQENGDQGHSRNSAEENEDLASQMDDLVRQHDRDRDEQRQALLMVQAENARLQSLCESSPTIELELSEKLQRKDRDIEALSATLGKMQQIRTSLVSEVEGLVERKEEQVNAYVSEMRERESAFEYERACLRKQLHEMERDLRQKNDDLKSMSIVVEAQRHHLEEKECSGGVDAQLTELSLESRHNTGDWHVQRKVEAPVAKAAEHRTYCAPANPRAHPLPGSPVASEDRRASYAKAQASTRPLTGRWPVRLGLIAPAPFGQRDSTAPNTQNVAGSGHSAMQAPCTTIHQSPRNIDHNAMNHGVGRGGEVCVSYGKCAADTSVAYGKGTCETTANHGRGAIEATVGYGKGGIETTVGYDKGGIEATVSYGKGGPEPTVLHGKGGLEPTVQHGRSAIDATVCKTAVEYDDRDGTTCGKSLAGHMEATPYQSPYPSDVDENCGAQTIAIMRPTNAAYYAAADSVVNRSVSSPAFKA